MNASSDAELVGTIKGPRYAEVKGVALWTAEIGAIVDGIAIIPRIAIVVWGINAVYAKRLPEGTSIRVRGHFKTDRFLAGDGTMLERTTFVVTRLLDPVPSVGSVATRSSVSPSGTI